MWEFAFKPNPYVREFFGMPPLNGSAEEENKTKAGKDHKLNKEKHSSSQKKLS